MKRFFCLCLVLILTGSSLSLPVRAEEPPVPETMETLPAETVQTTACTEEAELPSAAAEATQASTLPPDTEPAETETAPTAETVPATVSPTEPTVQTQLTQETQPLAPPEEPVSVTPIGQLSWLVPGMEGVTLRGTVVWVREHRIVLQDETGGTVLTLPENTAAGIGSQLQITGCTGEVFVPSQVEILGSGELPLVVCTLSQAPEALRVQVDGEITEEGHLAAEGRSLSLEAEEWTPGSARLTGVIVDGVFYAEEVLSFLPEPEIDFLWNHYAGQLHNHSALSGGWGSPGEIYAKSAREENMDFFAVTDHSDSFVGGEAGVIDADGSSVSPSWAEGKRAAKSAATPDFAPIFGFEMTWGKAHGLGHINTFGTSGWQTGNQLSSLEAYLNILERAPGSVNQFNHPGTAYGTFDGFRDYNPRYDRLMQLIEVFGEPGTEYLFEYFGALDAGWHLAPTAGSFCYDPDFGNARTVILAQTLSESSLLQALRQRRAYATQDGDLRLEFQLNGTDMGGFTTKADTMELTAQFRDETDGAVGKVEVLTIHGRVLAAQEITESAGELTLTLPGGYPYYLLRVTQADGDVAISAPVWAETFSDMGILEFSTAEAAPTAGTALTLELALFNREPVPMSVQSVTLYQGSQEVDRFRKTAEGRYQCDFTWDAPGELRLTAKVQAAVEGENRSYQKELVLHYTGGEAMSASVSDVRAGSPGTVYRLTGYAASGNTNSATTFPDTIYVQDETGGIPVRGTFPKGIQVGTPLDITGVLRTENEAPYLDLISLERTEETMRRPLPAVLGCREAMDYDTRGGQLVQIQGTLLSLEKEGNAVSRLTLRDGKGDKAVVLIEPEIRSGSGRTHKLSSKIQENRTVRAIGLVYRMADGTVVLRVRNCDEVVYVPPVPDKTNPKTGDPWQLGEMVAFWRKMWYACW